MPLRRAPVFADCYAMRYAISLPPLCHYTDDIAFAIITPCRQRRCRCHSRWLRHCCRCYCRHISIAAYIRDITPRERCRHYCRLYFRQRLIAAAITLTISDAAGLMPLLSLTLKPTPPDFRFRLMLPMLSVSVAAIRCRRRRWPPSPRHPPCPPLPPDTPEACRFDYAPLIFSADAAIAASATRHAYFAAFSPLRCHFRATLPIFTLLIRGCYCRQPPAILPPRCRMPHCFYCFHATLAPLRCFASFRLPPQPRHYAAAADYAIILLIAFAPPLISLLMPLLLPLLR